MYICTCDYLHLGTHAQLQELDEQPEPGEQGTPGKDAKEECRGKGKRKNETVNSKKAQPPPQVYIYCTFAQLIINVKPC